MLAMAAVLVATVLSRLETAHSQADLQPGSGADTTRSQLAVGNSHVFYVGMQKSGTSSFAHFMGELGFDSYHGGPPDQYPDIPPYSQSYNMSAFLHASNWWPCAAPPSMLMDVDTLVHEMIPAKRAALGAFLKKSARLSFAGEAPPISAADVMWPLLYKFLDEVTEGTSKFVFWPRNATEWAQSYFDFFDMSDTTFSRLSLLAYGRGCRTEMEVPLLTAAFDAHTAAVRAYFASSPSRAKRFLEIDFTLPDAGRTLCTFATDDAEGCAQYSTVPNVPPDELDLDWMAAYGHTKVRTALEAQIIAAPESGGFTCSERHVCAVRPASPPAMLPPASL